MGAQQFCGACGKPNREQARFCGYCGQPLRAPVPQQEVFTLEALKKQIKALQKAASGARQSAQQKRAKKTRNALALTILLVALGGLFIYTNPTVERYELFVRQQLLQEAQTDAERAVAALLGGFASWGVIQQTVRSDYLFFSLYETKIGNERLIALGILNNFMVLEVPRSVSTQNL